MWHGEWRRRVYRPAPDGLSSVGGYPGNDDKGRELQQQVDPTKLMNDFFAAIEFMQRYPQATGKVGITGFCYGGGVSNAAAVAYPELACAVPFYGRQAPTADVAKIEAPLLLHFAELDTRINEGWPAYEAALKANNKVYEAYIYPGLITDSIMIPRPVMTNLPPILPGKGH